MLFEEIIISDKKDYFDQWITLTLDQSNPLIVVCAFHGNLWKIASEQFVIIHLTNAFILFLVRTFLKTMFLLQAYKQAYNCLAFLIQYSEKSNTPASTHRKMLDNRFHIVFNKCVYSFLLSKSFQNHTETHLESLVGKM